MLVFPPFWRVRQEDTLGYSETPYQKRKGERDFSKIKARHTAPRSAKRLPVIQVSKSSKEEATLSERWEMQFQRQITGYKYHLQWHSSSHWERILVEQTAMGMYTVNSLITGNQQHVPKKTQTELEGPSFLSLSYLFDLEKVTQMFCASVFFSLVT